MYQYGQSNTHKHLGALRPHMPPTQPFTHYSVDFMFGFPSDGGRISAYADTGRHERVWQHLLRECERGELLAAQQQVLCDRSYASEWGRLPPGKRPFARTGTLASHACTSPTGAVIGIIASAEPPRLPAVLYGRFG
eukprot:COSAG02_NODE_641_length_19049_cov_119.025541_7_plen_136_part_00